MNLRFDILDALSDVSVGPGDPTTRRGAALLAGGGNTGWETELVAFGASVDSDGEIATARKEGEG